jgi:hypothetical protein
MQSIPNGLGSPLLAVDLSLFAHQPPMGFVPAVFCTVLLGLGELASLKQLPEGANVTCSEAWEWNWKVKNLKCRRGCEVVS